MVRLSIPRLPSPKSNFYSLNSFIWHILKKHTCTCICIYFISSRKLWICTSLNMTNSWKILSTFNEIVFWSNGSKSVDIKMNITTSTVKPYIYSIDASHLFFMNILACLTLCWSDLTRNVNLIGYWEMVGIQM